MELVEQHSKNTGRKVATVEADRQYGTAENFRSCQEMGIETHMGDMLEVQEAISSRQGIYPESEFEYDAKEDCYRDEMYSRDNIRAFDQAALRA